MAVYKCCRRIKGGADFFTGFFLWGEGGAVTEWVRELDWRPGGPGFESRCAPSLRNFDNSIYPALPVSFGGDTKAVGPVYLVSMPREVKYPTSLHYKCVTCRELHHSVWLQHPVGSGSFR